MKTTLKIVSDKTNLDCYELLCERCGTMIHNPLIDNSVACHTCGARDRTDKILHEYADRMGMKTLHGDDNELDRNNNRLDIEII